MSVTLASNHPFRGLPVSSIPIRWSCSKCLAFRALEHRWRLWSSVDSVLRRRVLFRVPGGSHNSGTWYGN